MLRERLRELDPSLSEALDKGWAIALDEWLPALGLRKDSYNSYPHIRNLERYLDEIVSGFEEYPGTRLKVSLNALEIYLLLSAILYHDVGRLLKDGQGHGLKSRELINKHRAELGIQNAEIAESLGRICDYHDTQVPEAIFRELRDVYIPPYGAAREKPLAALLVLIDTLDSAYNRVIPQYLKSLDDLDVIGAFRSIIDGVLVDCRARMVKTVLGSIMESGVDAPSAWDDFKIISNSKPELVLAEYTSTRCYNYLIDNIRNKDITGVCLNRPFTDLECEIVLGIKKIAEKAGSSKWPKGLLLAMVMANVQDNCKALTRIRETLSAIGVPILAWVIEYKDHLYNVHGDETFEPNLSKLFLNDCATRMWELSTKIFGTTYFTYEQLAGHMREPNVNRVKVAVRRLSIITTDARGTSPIRYGDSNWKWVSNKDQYNSTEVKHCIYQSLTDVKNTIIRMKVANSEF